MVGIDIDYSQRFITLFHLQKKVDSDDEDKYADDIDMPGQKFETKQRITVRNLRIREDTAKVSTIKLIELHVSAYSQQIDM